MGQLDLRPYRHRGKGLLFYHFTTTSASADREYTISIRYDPKVLQHRAESGGPINQTTHWIVQHIHHRSKPLIQLTTFLEAYVKQTNSQDYTLTGVHPQLDHSQCAR